MYLGLPYLIGITNKEIFSYCRERVWKKTHAWKEKLLSMGGKEVLIKFVIQAIPCYVMLVFKIPITMCREIHASIRRF